MTYELKRDNWSLFIDDQHIEQVRAVFDLMQIPYPAELLCDEQEAWYIDMHESELFGFDEGKPVLNRQCDNHFTSLESFLTWYNDCGTYMDILKQREDSLLKELEKVSTRLAELKSRYK